MSPYDLGWAGGLHDHEWLKTHWMPEMKEPTLAAFECQVSPSLTLNSGHGTRVCTGPLHPEPTLAPPLAHCPAPKIPTPRVLVKQRPLSTFVRGAVADPTVAEEPLSWLVTWEIKHEWEREILILHPSSFTSSSAVFSFLLLLMSSVLCYRIELSEMWKCSLPVLCDIQVSH